MDTSRSGRIGDHGDTGKAGERAVPGGGGMRVTDRAEDALVSVDGVRFAPDVEPWRPDLATRDELRILTAHIGAHPPVVGATPYPGRWPTSELGPGVTAWWDPDRCRPLRRQQHVCRTILHDLIEARAPLAPTFLLHHDTLFLTGGHHHLWLLVAARVSGLLEGPLPVFVHVPVAGHRPPPELRCSCRHRPPHTPLRNLA